MKATEHTPERFLWIIDDAESARLTTLLGFDFAALDIGGTYVNTPKLSCHHCGKLSGLDDFVAGALHGGIHKKDFIIKVLKGDGADVQASPPHKLRCMNCNNHYMKPKKQGTLFDWDEKTGKLAVAGWASTFDWAHKLNDMKSGPEPEKPAPVGWLTGTGFSWTYPKSKGPKPEKPATVGWAIGFNWTHKRSKAEEPKQ